MSGAELIVLAHLAFTARPVCTPRDPLGLLPWIAMMIPTCPPIDISNELGRAVPVKGPPYRCVRRNPV